MPRRRSKSGKKIKRRSGKKLGSKRRTGRRSGQKTRTKKRSRKIFRSALGLGALGAMGLGLKHYYDKQYVIEVMSDVEGCWNKVVSFMSKSSIFTVDGQPITNDNFKPEDYNKIRMRSNSKFVCLGDTIDNGPNNLAILHLLKFLKEKYKSKVILIVGNRDLNKLRLKFEIINIEPRKNLARLIGNPKEKASFIANEGNYIIMSPVDKLKWLLKYTFGAENTFKYMKNEIGTDNDQVVVDKYLEILGEVGNDDQGLLTYYLKNGKLIYYDQKTKSLFAHGGINCKNFGKSGAKTITEWVSKLNTWYQNNLKLAYTDKDESKIEELLLYQDERDYVRGENEGAIYSVILSRPWKTPPIVNPGIGIGTSIIEEGCFDQIAKEVKFIFAGHTPVGQIPVMMRVNNNGRKIIFVFCDTTFAGRVGNVKLVKGNVVINAQYYDDRSLPQSLTQNDICTKIEPSQLVNVTYSSEDPNIGLIKDDGLVVAKINNKYALGKWIGKPNENNPAFIETQKFVFKESLT